MRYQEVDALRGIAIILMVAYHFLFDLEFLGISRISSSDGIILMIGRASAILFLLTVGISMQLSFNSGKSWLFQVKRGARIFLAGMLVTAATYIIYPEGTIIFGILHLIGISVIILYPLSYLPILTLFIFPLSIALGSIFKGILYYTPWFLPLGIRFYGFSSLDYYPIFPWIGVIAAGIAIGKALYVKGGRRIALLGLSDEYIPKCLPFIGRHSLLIYLLHQPVLLGLLLVVF